MLFKIILVCVICLCNNSENTHFLGHDHLPALSKSVPALVPAGALKIRICPSALFRAPADDHALENVYYPYSKTLVAPAFI
jgi:hypothetical protein